MKNTLFPFLILLLVLPAAISSAQIEVASDGKVGVGTASPVTSLHVVGSDVASPLWQSEAIRVTSGQTAGFGVDGASTYWGVSLFQNGTKVFTVDSNGGALIGASYVHLNAPENGLAVQGNVGIGTTSPESRLHVTANADPGAGSFAIRTGGAYGGGILFADTGLGAIYMQDSGQTMNFAMGSSSVSPVMALKSSGLAITGTASVQASGGIPVWLSGNANAVIGLGGSTSSFPAIRYNGATEVGVVLADQSVYAAIRASAFNVASDRRLKTHIRPLTNSGDVIDALQPRMFDWKSGEKDAVGFVAQELYEAAPYAVTAGDDDPGKITYQWAVDASKLVPVLTAEVKALRGRLKEQEERSREQETAFRTHRTERESAAARTEAALTEQRQLTAELSQQLAELRRQMAALQTR